MRMQTMYTVQDPTIPDVDKSNTSRNDDTSRECLCYVDLFGDKHTCKKHTCNFESL